MRGRHIRHDHPSGFTLVELVLVIVAVAVLSMIAIPRYANSVNRYKVELAAKRVVADFALARASARSSGAGQLVTFSTQTSSYTMAGLAAADKSTGDYVVKLAEEPFKVSISSAVFGTSSAASVRFTRFGIPESGGGSVVVGSGGYSKTIKVDSITGRAEVQ